jgi:hypothetical protein
LARLPIDPRLVELADHGRIEEFDDPVVDLLAQRLDDVLAARPKPKPTISLI